MKDVKITIALKTDADLSCLRDIIEGYVVELAEEIESYLDDPYSLEYEAGYEVEPAENIEVSVAYDEEEQCVNCLPMS